MVVKECPMELVYDAEPIGSLFKNNKRKITTEGGGISTVMRQVERKKERTRTIETAPPTEMCFLLLLLLQTGSFPPPVFSLYLLQHSVHFSLMSDGRQLKTVCLQ